MTIDVNSREHEAPPIFVMCGARSGSTLMRLILDSHPDISCPPESNMILALSQYARSLSVLLPKESKMQTNELPEINKHLLREFASRAWQPGLDRNCKTRIADKSLGNFAAGQFIEQIWPDAKYICLVRHVMDFIKSGLDSSPYGLSSYGFEPYASSNSQNHVLALARYWIDHVSAITRIHESSGERSCLIRYEDLVSAPEIVVKNIWDVLEVEPMELEILNVFNSAHDENGPADYKIWTTDRIHSDSVGRGLSVPAELIPRQVLEPLNDLLSALDYSPVDEYWGDISRPLWSNGKSETPTIPPQSIDTSEQPITLVIGDGPHIVRQYRVILSVDGPEIQALNENNAVDSGVRVVADLRTIISIKNDIRQFSDAIRDRKIRFYRDYVPASSEWAGNRSSANSHSNRNWLELRSHIQTVIQNLEITL